MNPEIDAANILIFMKGSTYPDPEPEPEKCTKQARKKCQICHIQTSPIWRKLPGYTCVCNRCGLKHKRK
jgi:hypothetical protein